MTRRANIDRISRAELWRSKSGRSGSVSVDWVNKRAVAFRIDGVQYVLEHAAFLDTYIEAHLFKGEIHA